MTAFSPRKRNTRQNQRPQKVGDALKKTVRVMALLGFGAVGTLLLGHGPAVSGEVLDGIKKRGAISCGVGEQHHGFTLLTEEGRFEGFDVDFCRALSSAVFGQPDKVQFVSLNNKNRFPALLEGEIDVLIRTTTWTLTRDAAQPVDFAGVNLYDGQGFMAPASMGAKSLKDVKEAVLCTGSSSTGLLNAQDYAKTNTVEFETRVYDTRETMVSAFFTGKCNLFVDDRSSLASIRANEAPRPSDFVILSDVMSKEPLGPAVLEGDSEWFDIVKWTVQATVQAEEMGLSSQNISERTDKEAESNPALARFVGVNPTLGEALGLDPKWAYHVISQVGNYGEIFDRHIGKGTKLNLDRGVNALWTQGGLMYAPPFR